jgi:hypothetical protein
MWTMGTPRACHDEWDNSVAPDQGRCLVVEWTVGLRPLQVLKSCRQSRPRAKPCGEISPIASCAVR